MFPPQRVGLRTALSRPSISQKRFLLPTFSIIFQHQMLLEFQMSWDVQRHRAELRMKRKVQNSSRVPHEYRVVSSACRAGSVSGHHNLCLRQKHFTTGDNQVNIYASTIKHLLTSSTMLVFFRPSFIIFSSAATEKVSETTFANIRTQALLGLKEAAEGFTKHKLPRRIGDPWKGHIKTVYKQRDKLQTVALKLSYANLHHPLLSPAMILARLDTCQPIQTNHRGDTMWRADQCVKIFVKQLYHIAFPSA